MEPRSGGEALIERYSAEWHAATRHPFLEAIANGSLSAAAFNTWLAQDYLFVADLLVFQAQLLARAPRAAQAVLAAGLVALEAELGWFEGRVQRRGLGPHVERQPTTVRYKAILDRLNGAPYAVAITGLWTLERAYLDAWHGALPCADAYREFVEHWTVPAFGDYVAGLARAADLALSSATARVRAQSEAAFIDVARMERDFWEMAWSG